MTTISNGLPIEFAVTLAMDKVSSDATQDLRGIVDKVDHNMQMKERVRQAQRMFEMYKDAVRNGNDGSANYYRTQIYNLLSGSEQSGGLGLNYWNSAEGKAAWELPSSGLAGMSQEDRDKLLSGKIKSFESLLESRAQSYSDIGQKLQFQLQEANNIFTRANKMQSDVSQKYNQTLDGIAQNMKG
jgi:hypothetical protein